MKYETVPDFDILVITAMLFTAISCKRNKK